MRIDDVLNNHESNYILPFLWLHNEGTEVITDNIRAIADAGIKAFCIESRPHPDFVHAGWWNTLDVVLAEANKRHMKVWILDDSHFPTGYANGEIIKQFPQYQKLYLNINQLDFAGPQVDATILLKYTVATDRAALMEKSSVGEGKILKVIAASIIGENQIDANSLIDLTDHIVEDQLHWNVPEGQWRVFTLVETTAGGERETEGYLNPLVANATQVLIDTVYESHYVHYATEFGQTIAGFFSDEPRFGNQHGSDSVIGQQAMVLPWRPGMLDEFFADDWLFLPLLTQTNAAGVEKRIRVKYMNIVSKLYAQNFTQVIGDWCHQHHVEYIGHLIEDNGAHTRLGYGAGHYFRALAAQDMAGIDVVLNQIMPGMDSAHFKSMTAKGWNGEFFHYGLAKLGSALGHLDPKKHGRVMSEVFGAYGWGEGLPLMKFIADHMLVRGVNHFVPHAFDPKAFPDSDCPPHFYANGHAPEARLYPYLFNYMNRMAHLFSGGHYSAHVAVLYHAEAEWADGVTMPFEKPMRVLMQHQIEAEVVPLDYLLDAPLESGHFTINGESFSTLIVPAMKTATPSLIESLKRLDTAGVKIIYVDQAPSQNLALDTVSPAGSVVALDQLADVIDSKDRALQITEFLPHLRTYRYLHKDIGYTMLVNEATSGSVEFTVHLNQPKPLTRYDGMRNTVSVISQAPVSETKLSLAAGESMVLIEAACGVAKKQELRSSTAYELKNWQVSFATAESYPEFGNKTSLDQLKNVNRMTGFTDFSGNMRYETEINLPQKYLQAYLALGQVGEVADICVNDQHIGGVINAPYTINLGSVLRRGKNTIQVTVINNLGINQADFLTQFMLIKPAGLLGPVTLTCESQKEEIN